MTNRLGSVRDTNDSNAVATFHTRYTLLDNSVNSTGSGGDRFGFTGREFDPISGLQFNRARYYNPELGRWNSEDPIGFAGGDANLYRYVGNSPLNATDPMGLEWYDIFGFPPLVEQFFINLESKELDAKLEALRTKAKDNTDTFTRTNQILDRKNMSAYSNLQMDNRTHEYASEISAAADTFGQVAVASIVVAGIVLPDPGDVVMAGILAKAGLRTIGKELFDQAGKRITKETAEKLLEEYNRQLMNRNVLEFAQQLAAALRKNGDRSSTRKVCAAVYKNAKEALMGQGKSTERHLDSLHEVLNCRLKNIFGNKKHPPGACAEIAAVNQLLKILDPKGCWGEKEFDDFLSKVTLATVALVNGKPVQPCEYCKKILGPDVFSK